MRVKKLSASRRPKAGDDDDSSVGSNSASPPPAHAAAATWASPTKPDHLLHEHEPQLALRQRASDIGSSSPTDPSGVHHPLELAAAPRLLFGDVLGMANSQHPHHHLHHSARETTGATSARKPAAPAVTAPKKSSSAGSWREHVPGPVRDGIHAKIVEYLKALKPNAPEAVLARLPGLASRMETTLLQLASSQEEFVDTKTLAARLGAIQQTNAKKLLQQQTTPLPTATAATSGGAASYSPADVALRSRTPLSEDQARFVFQCLQNWRQKLVTIYGVAPWEILPNAILAKVAVYAPSTEQELAICGVRDEQVARFGSALLQELQLICGSTAGSRAAAVAAASPVLAARNSGGSHVKASRKAETSKRPQEPKKRKTTVLAPAVESSARLAPTNAFVMPPPSAAASGVSSAPSPMMPLFRATAGMDALPSLLPSGSGLKPSPLFAPPPRLPSPRTPSSAAAAPATSEELHSSMHLLAQGAGHVSKQQQDAQTIDAYEKELQSTRWLLQQAQQENERLREQVQQLLHQQHHHRQ